MVSFGAGSYSVDETDDTSTTEDKENEAVVTVTLSADPERTVTIPISKANQGGASSADYSGVPASVVFNTGETSKTFTFAATADTVDDDGESVKIGFGTLPSGVSEGTTKETTVSITDDDLPADVEVEFEQGSYTVTEGSNVTVKVTLSEDPERTVTIPIEKANEGGTSDSDYSGVPASLTFNSGDTEKSFVFSTTADNLEDSGESVKLTFGTTLPTGVTEGTTNETVVSISNVSAQNSLTVNFGSASYSLSEGGTTTIEVRLSTAPGSDAVIPLTKADQGGASSADYSGVPTSVTFGSSDTERTFTFSATQDTVDDDGESVKLTFGTLPTGVTEGTTKETVVSITDDDVPSVTVSFGSATYSVEETDDTSTTEDKENEVAVTVTLSADPERTVTIPIVKADQGGASSSDYSGVPANVVFNSGDTSKTFTFSATQDTVDDDGESVKLTFGMTLPTGVTEGSTKETVVSITDDDAPSVTVSFGAAAYSVDETDDTTTTEDKENEAVVTVTLSADPERTVTIPIVKADQGGASSSDYSGVPANVVFNSGDTSKTFTFAATADSVDDDGESVKLTFGMALPTGVTEGSTKETVVSITDDDVPSVTVEFGAAAYSVEETDDTSTTEDKENEVAVTVTLSADPERTVTIPIDKVNQDGASSSDYSGVPASVVFNTGETSKTFTFAATADSVDDDGESVKLTFGMTPPDGVSEGSIKESVVSINDDDLPADVDVEFGQGSYTVAEGSTVTVTVTFSEDPERAVTIPISTANQGGASSSDYSGVPATITFASGETSKTFSFAATSDSVDDDGESVKLSFGTLPTGVTEGTTNETTVSITDDDVPSVTVSFGSANYSVDETDDTSTTEDKENEAVVTVTLSADPERTVTIPISKANQGGASSADYSGVPASVVFNSGETSKTFTFAATADTIDDDGESVKLTFGTTLPTRVAESATKESVVSINDDDLPADVDVEFSQGSYTVAEGSTVTVTVTLSEDPERTVTIPISKANQDGASSGDYSGVPASVVFDAGETSKTFSFAATSDTVDDDGESVKLSFGTLPTGVTEGTTNETTVSITDDDVPSVTVSFGSATYSVDETDDTSTTEDKENEAVVTVTLSADPERTVTIPISKANQGGASSPDYSGVPANVVFNSGETSKTFTFAATADTVDDDGESVKLTFGATLPTGVSEGTTKETTVSISDDDLPADVDVEFGQSSYTVAEGSTVTVTVTLSEDPERGVTIPVSKANQGEASSADYSGVPASVVFNAGETSKTFSFAATSDTVDDDGESVKLSFGTLPTGVTEGTTNETVVSITDDDVPAVSVAFGAAAYSVDETDDTSTTETKENEAVVTVTLSADPERTVTIPIDKANQGGASSADYSGVPASVVFNSGETSKTFTFAATSDSVDDDEESVKLTFGTTLPSGVAQGSTAETVVSIIDDDATAQPLVSLQVSFQGSAYLITEGWTTDITVVLSDDPERSVTIPLITTQSGAIAADYSGVPTSLTFESGDRDKSFTFTAVQDEADENDESVTLGFGDLPDGVSAGFPSQATVTIVDALRVSFGASRYQAHEGGFGAVVAVQFDSPVPLTTVIPINATGMNGATDHDWDGVPAVLTFSPGDQRKTFTVTAYDDEIEDDGESVELAFGILPTGVVSTHPRTATVELMNTEDSPVDQYTCPPDAGNRIVLEPPERSTSPGKSTTGG